MQALTTAASGVRHALMAVTEALLIAAIIALLAFMLAPISSEANQLAGTGDAVAAKGGNTNKGSGGGGKTSGATISLVVLDGTDDVANHRERVAFDVSTTATDRPFVGLRCYQGANFVLDGYTGYFDEYLYDPWITLGSPYWDPAVAADCTARLFYFDKRGNQKVLATLEFGAYP
jgi:hypothetical protein